ncbi:hypothetical protein VDGL01_01776, partial [Verticillium dahliae]
MANIEGSSNGNGGHSTNNPSAHSGTGGFDLLKRATQAMMMSNSNPRYAIMFLSSYNARKPPHSASVSFIFLVVSAFLPGARASARCLFIHDSLQFGVSFHPSPISTSR